MGKKSGQASPRVSIGRRKDSAAVSFGRRKDSAQISIAPRSDSAQVSFAPRADSVAVSIGARVRRTANLEKAVSVLTSVTDSVQVQVSGGVSAMVSVLQRLHGRVAKVSAVLTIRGSTALK